MGWEGEVAAGAGFLGIGLWQAFTSVKSYRLSGTSSGTARPRFSQGYIRHAEHVGIALVAVFHMIFSLVATLGQDDHNGSGVGSAISFESFGVSAVFLMYAVVALISEGSTVLPLPAAIVDLIAVFAFGEEFALFYFTDGDGDSPGLEMQYYSLLLVPIGVCLAATIMEIIYPVAVLPPFARSMALILQGTWFFQMGVSLFTKKWMAHGCDLIQDTEGVYTVSCEGMSLMRGKALATLQFNLHLALLIILFLLPMNALLRKGKDAPISYERIGDQATGGARNFHQGNENGQELSQATYFHVLEDEDEEDSQTKELSDFPDTRR